MSEGSDKLATIADNVEEAANALDYIAGLENDEDKARTLADNEVLHRVAGKFREAAQAAADQVDDPDQH